MSATLTWSSSTPARLHAVVEHDVAERARGGDAGRAGRQRLAGALVVDLGADRLLHPHPRPAGAAAHALGAVALHLDDLDALDRADDLARREVHVVVAAEVAGVVVGDRSSSVAWLTSSRPSAISCSSSCVWWIDLVVPAELRVLVLQRVEAVRALGDDLLHAHPVEHLDVGHRQHLEQVLVAAAPRRVAGAHLARPEDRHVDAGAARAASPSPA